MQKQAKRGICQRKRKFFGTITVTDKGQIAIPVELRRELGIENGDKLIILKRGDGNGINLIKSETMDKFIEKMSAD